MTINGDLALFDQESVTVRQPTPDAFKQALEASQMYGRLKKSPTPVLVSGGFVDINPFSDLFAEFQNGIVLADASLALQPADLTTKPWLLINAPQPIFDNGRVERQPGLRYQQYRPEATGGDVIAARANVLATLIERKLRDMPDLGRQNNLAQRDIYESWKLYTPQEAKGMHFGRKFDAIGMPKLHSYPKLCEISPGSFEYVADIEGPCMDWEHARATLVDLLRIATKGVIVNTSHLDIVCNTDLLGEWRRRKIELPNKSTSVVIFEK